MPNSVYDINYQAIENAKDEITRNQMIQDATDQIKNAHQVKQFEIENQILLNLKFIQIKYTIKNIYDHILNAIERDSNVDVYIIEWKTSNLQSELHQFKDYINLKKLRTMFESWYHIQLKKDDDFKIILNALDDLLTFRETDVDTLKSLSKKDLIKLIQNKKNDNQLATFYKFLKSIQDLQTSMMKTLNNWFFSVANIDKNPAMQHKEIQIDIIDDDQSDFNTINDLKALNQRISKDLAQLVGSPLNPSSNPNSDQIDFDQKYRELKESLDQQINDLNKHKGPDSHA